MSEQTNKPLLDEAARVIALEARIAELEAAKQIDDFTLGEWGTLTNMLSHIPGEFLPQKVRGLLDAVPTVPRVVMEECHQCDGSGKKASLDFRPGIPLDKCTTCDGEGEVAVKCGAIHCNNGMYIWKNTPPTPCRLCHGHGYAAEQSPLLVGDEVWRIDTMSGKPFVQLYRGCQDHMGEVSLILDDSDELFLIDPDVCYANEATSELLGACND